MNILRNNDTSARSAALFGVGLWVISLLLAGCATVTPGESAARIGPDSLLAGTALAGIQADGRYVENGVLLLSPAMSAFIDQAVDRDTHEYRRLHQLIYALIGEGTFGLTYDDQTQTAVETFEERRGNCLSFTNMFVAMARDVGLKVSYQEVDIPPDWTVSDGTFLLSRHVNVRVDLGRDAEQVVDFNIGDFRTTYNQRVISDDRALAHFYNNKGVEYLQKGDTGAALANLQRSLQHDSKFGPAWSNLGTLYGRQRLPAYAEASYLQALAVNSDEYVAMSNLARLYAEQGDIERSTKFERRTAVHRQRNPYYRFSLAREAYLKRDYDTAISNLKFAIRQREFEDSFYFLLGLSYLHKGDERLARKWMNKAEEVAKNGVLKKNYQSKIDMLLSAE